MEDYKYKLEPYKGSSSRHICPSCGHKGEFVRYIDAMGHYLDKSCGKCNRGKCGYHLTPKQFFAEHPDKRESADRASSRQLYTPIVPSKPQSFLSLSILDSIKPMCHRNALYVWLCTIFDVEEVSHAFDLYKVGTAKMWRKDGHYSCAFPQIDEQGRLCQLKVMAYNPTNGKRLHKEHTCEIWNDRLQAYVDAPKVQDRLMFLGKRIAGQDANLKQCFFGQHLLKDAELVGIVESEKSAIIASTAMPNFCWVATGGKNGVRLSEPHQLDVLKGKRVVMFADEDAIEEWERRAKILQSHGIDASVSHICEGRGSHTDIADLIVENQLRIKKEKAEPTYQAQTIGQLCQMLHEIKFPKERIKINC